MATTDDAWLLVRMGDEAGGRVDPERIASRPPGSTSREAFGIAQTNGWLDSDGWITAIGREALGREGATDAPE